MIVVGYRDLRPVDWVSGKRMPLGPGEGHVCDRCGREHAVVYEVMDEATRKTYCVGSGCAKQEFGFDVERDAGSKALVRSAKKAAQEILWERRREMVRQAVKVILDEFEYRIAVPAAVVEDRGPEKPAVVHVGDGSAWVQHRTLEETTRVATQDFVDKRIRELTPPGWDRAEIPQRPGSRHGVSMAHLLASEVCASLKERL